MPTRWIVLCCLLLALASPSRAGQAERRSALRGAFDAAEQGQLELEQARRFNDDPLYGWLQATIVRRRIGVATETEIAPILRRLEDQAAGRWLRDSWLSELVRRQDWQAFHRAYRGSENPLFRCADLTARMGGGDSGTTSADQRWTADARALWLTGESLPDECDAPFARLTQIGQLDEALRWQRLDLAAAKGQSALIRHIAKTMTPDDAALAQSYAAYLDAPNADVPASWGKGGRSRAVATAGLVRLAKRDPDRANALLGPVSDRLGLDDGQRGRVRYEVALWSVASYLPGAAARMAAVPAAVFDDKLHEWQVREAISRGADAAALAAIVRMGDAQRNDSHWQYFEARLRERLGDADAAHALYERAARSPTFHGWLAADRLQRPYALCALEPLADRKLAGRVAENAALSRALDLVAIERTELAAREWASAIKGLSDDERRLAVQRAIADGWYDRSVFGMGVVPDDSRHYSLRFPLHHEADIRRQSQLNGLDPAWVAGQARAESSFMPKARSPADARGLMQLLPGTGALTARRLGEPWQGSESLYEPATNIRLGTAYLRQMLDRFDGAAYLAIAAYNAGPAPVARWRAARPQLEPDFFIESIPYKETREYVSRVLAFSVVYDWRLNGDASPLSERMLGRLVSEPSRRRPFTCPSPNASGP